MRLRDLRNLNIQERIAVLETEIKNGCNVNVMYQSFPKLRKEFNGRVKKTTCGVCSMKKDYRNLKINEGRTDFEGLYGGSEKFRYVIPNLLIEKNENGMNFTATMEDHFLMLSTCDDVGAKDGRRVILIAKRVM